MEQKLVRTSSSGPLAEILFEVGGKSPLDNTWGDSMVGTPILFN